METTRAARGQTRTPATIAAYLSRAHHLLCRIADELQLPDDAYPAPSDVVTYMKLRAKEWKWATFRQYQASLVCRYEIEFERKGEALFRRTAEEIRSLPYGDCKPENQLGQTSSRKRKGLPKCDYDVLVANLMNPARGSDIAKRAGLWLMAGIATGLRPCEWQNAKLSEVGDTLIVQNAKATNGRANGESRTIPVSPDDFSVVRAHIESLQELRARGIRFAAIQKGASQAIRRMCDLLWPGDAKRAYTLYSARHQYSANIKTIASVEEVAALLGHRSTRTARRHYAKRRNAWSQFKHRANVGTLGSTAGNTLRPLKADRRA